MKNNSETYERVIARIVAALERGEGAVWQKPWRVATGRPRSMSSGKPYKGVNVLLLAVAAMEQGYASPWWATYRQIAEQGGQVRRGETCTHVLLFKERHITETVDGEAVTKRVPVARAFTVFNACQADGLPEKFFVKPAEEHTLAGPQEVLDAYLQHGGPKMQHAAGDRAYYTPATDTITLPVHGQFRSPEGYYSTAFHECSHSTGHKLRLDREGIVAFDHFGSEQYSREELVAQLGSAMLCAETGLENDDLHANDVAYLKSWARVLKGDPKMLVTAASHAQKAADLVLEPSREIERAADETQGAGPVQDRELELA